MHQICDLFEGSISYPHVEEDDAIALLRCQDYVYTFDLNFYTGFGNYNGGMIYIHLPNKVREMVGKPNVINLNNVTDFPIYYDGIREEVTITNIVLANGYLQMVLSSPISGLIYKSVAFATSNFIILFSSEQS